MEKQRKGNVQEQNLRRETKFSLTRLTSPVT